MKHLLIIISFLFLSYPVIGDSKKRDTLYRWGEYPDYVWKGFGKKETNPKYRGHVENGVPKGLGILIYPKGNKYEGGWNNGEMNGRGTETFSNGDKYEGEYKDGLPNGKGTETWSDGNKYVGEYKDDFPWNGKEFDKKGNIQYKIVNGKWIKQ